MRHIKLLLIALFISITGLAQTTPWASTPAVSWQTRMLSGSKQVRALWGTYLYSFSDSLNLHGKLASPNTWSAKNTYTVGVQMNYGAPIGFQNSANNAALSLVSDNVSAGNGQAIFRQHAGDKNVMWKEEITAGTDDWSTTGQIYTTNGVQTAGAFSALSGSHFTQYLYNYVWFDRAGGGVFLVPPAGILGGSVVYNLQNKVGNYDLATTDQIPGGGVGGTIVNSITGTANQIIASSSTGAVTLSTPQDINTGSSPTFAALKTGGAGGNGYVDYISQTSHPTGVSGHLRQYRDSVGSFAYMNGLFRRTFKVNRLRDETITYPYRNDPTLADSTDVAAAYAPISSSVNYIQNQTSSSQSGAGFWTGGSGRVDGSLSVGGATLGSTVFTAINNATNSTAAFQNTNAAGYSAFNIYNNLGVLSYSQGHGNSGVGGLAGINFFNSNDASPMYWYINTTEKLRLTSSGLGTTIPVSINSNPTTPAFWLNVTGAAITGREKLFNATTSDAPTNSFLAIANGTQTASTFDPSIYGVQSTSARTALSFRGLIDDTQDSGINPAVIFIGGRYTGGSADPINDAGSALVTRPIIGFNNLNNTVVTIAPTGRIKSGMAGFQGGLDIAGSGSGIISINAQSAAGTYNFNLPIDAGNTGKALVSGGGGSTAMTWANLPITGQITLVAGVGTATITGLSTSSTATTGFVSIGGTITTTWQYKVVCTANTLTITAITNTGTTDSTDTSTLNYSATK